MDKTTHQISIEKSSGLQLCEFKSNDDFCNTCDEEIKAGDDIYFESTSHETDEGEYHCEKCAINRPAQLDKELGDLARFINQTGGYYD